MKWRPPAALAARVGGPIISTLMRTWRWEVGDDRPWRQLHEAGSPYLFLLWHDALLPLLWHHRHQGIAILVSEGRDGRYLADYANGLGYQCVYGSSSRGGLRALLEAVRVLRKGTPVAITPDGPRGPRRTMKPGILAAAERARVPIVPIHAVASRGWWLRSWDRFLIPKPFAKVRVGYGESFRVGEGEATNQAVSERAARELTAIEEGLAWPAEGVTATD
jgi:lysophospholipid acyltransferase (LPLAT)-like uncharacterized protein